ncbi:MAG TPA: hypothetical protein VNZ05_10215 [Solirubrobacteraceae bacterium]|jgi:hypothetical protein|nr:hypothetical protein [Solirubrobacteraceae bacterium]
MEGHAGELVETAIGAHGGRALWDGAREVSVRVSSGGLAFASKLQGSAVRDVEARVSTGAQRVLFTPYPVRGQRGVLDEDGSVRIEAEDGRVLERREHPRAAFSDLRHKLWWDRLDILYFGAYAMWTYLSAPFVFAREEYRVRELEPWDEDGQRWRRLSVTYPASVQTHCPEQVFYLDEEGLIRRHDYTAEPIGGWAKAAHFSYELESFDGLVVPTRREVFPRRGDNRPRARPRLVWIEVSHGELVR